MDKRDERLLTTPIPEFDAPAALVRFRDRAARERVVPAPRALDRLARLVTRPWTRPLAAALGAVVVVAALTVTGVADTILTVFEPQRVAVVQVDPAALSGIPDPSQYGTLTWIARPSLRPATDTAGAAAVAGFTPLVPTSLPAGLPAQPRVAVVPEAKATFQFDEAKASAAAAAAGASLPPMPSGIASTTLTLSGGPAIVQRYGSSEGGASCPSPLGCAPAVTETTGSGGDAGGPLGLGSMKGPQLVIVQSRVPVVTSNGATVDELRDYALRQPGIPPALAAQIRAIGDPVRTLMLPVGIDMGNAKPVTVRGTQGYLVGDETGLGSGVVWVENGYVVGVFGTLTDSELLTLVNGLR